MRTVIENRDRVRVTFMGYGFYEKDIVTERDRKEYIKHNLIKRYNVNYVDPELIRKQEEEQKRLEEERRQKDEEERQIQEAIEIFNRLEQEKEADEAVKRAEIEAALAAQEAMSAANYNSTTGAYSGSYGKGEIQEDNRDQIESILKEKNDAFMSMLENETSKQNNG